MNMNKKIFLRFLQLFKIIAGGRFLGVFLSALVPSGDANNANSCRSPYGSWRITRAILMQITLSSPLSRSSSSVTSHTHSLLLSLSPVLFHVFFFFLLPPCRTVTVSHTALPPARFRRDADARACAPVFYCREPPAFFLSIFLFFHAATPRVTTLGRHVHDFRLPLVVAASFLPLFLFFRYRVDEIVQSILISYSIIFFSIKSNKSLFQILRINQVN